MENWWGAQTYPTIITDMRNGLVTQQLLDGTYFSMTFPNWPELGTPCEDAGPSPSELTPIWFYTLVYFYDEIAIPTGNSVTVEAHYQCSRLPGSLLMDELTFAPCADGIPFQSHTLTIGKAENVDILQQNLGLNLSSSSCTVELDPTRTDYSFQFRPK